MKASIPLAGLDGSVTGTNIHGSITGAGDSSYVASTGFAVKYNYSWGKGST